MQREDLFAAQMKPQSPVDTHFTAYFGFPQLSLSRSILLSSQAQILSRR